jgi:hypothetical protein
LERGVGGNRIYRTIRDKGVFKLETPIYFMFFTFAAHLENYEVNRCQKEA